MQWCTKNNFLIASSIHINWCFRNLSKCVHRLRFQILQNYFYSCFQCVQFSKLVFECLLLFSLHTNFRQNTYISSSASWQWFVCHCMHSSSNNQVEISKIQCQPDKVGITVLFYFLYLSVRQQQAVQSFVPLSACLFFEAASSFTITCTCARLRQTMHTSFPAILLLSRRGS